MNIAAIAISAAALYICAATLTKNRAAAHFRRAAGLYAARCPVAADAHMERGRQLSRRADRMLLGLMPSRKEP
jgi:hypothetical protein